MPQSGQLPGSFRRICGCMGQVYTVPRALGAETASAGALGECAGSRAPVAQQALGGSCALTAQQAFAGSCLSAAEQQALSVAGFMSTSMAVLDPAASLSSVPRYGVKSCPKQPPNPRQPLAGHVPTTG